MKTQQIKYTDENAAKYVKNIEGWVDINGRFFGNNKDSEHMARYSSATHLECKCGNLMTKGWTKCEECRTKDSIEYYSKLPFKEYTNELVYSEYADRYFNNSDEIEEYCEDNKVEYKDLRLVFCKPSVISPLDFEQWYDLLPEDSDSFPKDFEDAVDKFNETISKLPPLSYYPGKIRTEYYGNKENNSKDCT